MRNTLYRGLACLIGLVGAIISNNILLLVLGLLLFIMLLTLQSKLIEFCKFGLTVILPIGIVLIFIWGFVRQGAPGLEKSLESGILYAIRTTLRLALLAGIFLATVLTLTPEQLIYLFRTFGIRGRALAVVLSCLNLWKDFQFCIRQVYVSRCARGLMPNCRFLTRLKQFPYAVRTLFISVFTQTIDRIHIWESDGLIERLDDFSECAVTLKDRSEYAGVLLLSLSSIWTLTAILCFFYSLFR